MMQVWWLRVPEVLGVLTYSSLRIFEHPTMAYKLEYLKELA
jgi:hypothetical protein